MSATAPPLPANLAATPGGEGRLPRLLIVDDEQALMQALCNTLAQQGYHTTGCVSAEEALACLGGQSFDLLLTDLMMPLTDGLTLARAALALRPQMVAVMMTGQGSISTAVEAMQSGVLDYVLKPFKLAHMLPVLERALAIARLRSENAALQERVAERTRELENANTELEAYAAAVSHDLRAPLRSIDGLTRMLAGKLGTALPQDTRHVLDLIGACATRGQRLVEDLLRLSHVSRQPLARSTVDVAALVQEVAAELLADPAGRMSARVEIVSPLPVAQADPALLRQVIVNLLGNALKFSERSALAKVEVSCARMDGADTYCVADNGPGFEPGGATRLFQPFERLPGAEGFEGSGVGLSIVQRIVQRHGGRVWAEASPGAGARFYFTLEATAAQTSAA